MAKSHLTAEIGSFADQVRVLQAALQEQQDSGERTQKRLAAVSESEIEFRVRCAQLELENAQQAAEMASALREAQRETSGVVEGMKMQLLRLFNLAGTFYDAGFKSATLQRNQTAAIKEEYQRAEAEYKRAEAGQTEHVARLKALYEQILAEGKASFKANADTLAKVLYMRWPEEHVGSTQPMRMRLVASVE
jgi:hypothetical protein